MAGILSYGSYVPYHRIKRQNLPPEGKGERAVASFDEDTTSLAVEAAREALRGSESKPTALLFASTAHAYAEKINAGVLHAALDLPAATRTLDLSSTSRAGLSALGLASSLSGPTLVAASDIVTGAAAGTRESAGGDASCAFLIANDQNPAAKILATAAVSEELLDVWRSPDQRFARQWEQRFGEEVLTPALESAFDRALTEAHLTVRDLTRVAIDATNPRIARAFAKRTRLSAEQLAPDLARSVGRAGSAHAGLLLATLLDQATPGDKLAVACAADGAEVIIVEVTDRIDEARPHRSVADWLAAGRNDLAYTTFLKWRGVLPFEPPRRPDPSRPAGPPIERASRWKFAFVGSRCNACGGGNLPPQRVCVLCGAVDKMDPEPYADAKAKIATYTVDHLAYSLHPPVVAAIVDFEQGGRFQCQLTDVDPNNVKIGDQLEMTFRRLYTADGVHNYFWKARPTRTGKRQKR